MLEHQIKILNEKKREEKNENAEQSSQKLRAKI